jgi:hypothetical protein
MQPRIFVSIASYRDTECQWTVKDLFDKARHPDRVVAGICWQFIPEEDADCFVVRTRPEQCRVIEVDARESRGVCWARSRIQSLWAGEEYFFQIDAHSRFALHWDEMLVEMLRSCPSERPVLSTYPATYVPPDKLGPDVVGVLAPREFSDQGVLVLYAGAYSPADLPAVPPPSAFVGAGTIFAPGEVIREVPYDPYLYFLGEEITLAARLWTHGWDIYTPNKVVVYHEYERRESKRRHWDDHGQWLELSRRSERRIRHLLGTEPCTDAQVLVDIDRYGLGSRRSLADYEALAGVDFRRRLVGGRTEDEIEAEEALKDPEKRITARFAHIWRSNTWACAETRSGTGSSLAQTEALRRKLPELFERLGVRALVDAGCGELNWMGTISENLPLYLGYDVVEEIVADLRRRFEPRKNHFFNTADITRHVLPPADAILCRDVLTHYNHALVRVALDNFRKSGARYLIATTFARGRNDPIRIGGWQPIDLCAAPFDLRPPEILVVEELPNSPKALGVWRLDALHA